MRPALRHLCRAIRARRTNCVRALAALALAVLLAGPERAAAQQAATLAADRISVEGDARLVAEGAVEVLFRSTRLRAARIAFDRRTGRLDIAGPITILDGADGTGGSGSGSGAILLADAAELDSDLRNGILLSARLVLDEQLQLAAARARRVDGRYTELERTVASSCQVCAAHPVALWSIRARRVVHDAETRQLHFDQATLRIMDVPVFYLPRLRVPDPTVARASGFLVPSFRSTSRLGTGLKIPYFLTFGPSRDLTLTPYLSTATRTLEARYRQAFRSGRIEFSGAASRDDTRANGGRAYVFGKGEFALPRDFRLSFNLEAVSDPAYLLDYGYSGKDRLTSFASLSRIRRNERIDVRLAAVRSLRASEIPIQSTLPQTVAHATIERRFPGLAGGEGRLSLALDGYRRASQADIAGRDGLRLRGEAGWRRAILFGPGIEADLEAQIAADSHVIARDSRYPRRLGRFQPAVSATLRWPLARRSGAGAVSVLEPVAQIAWSESYGRTPPDEDAILVEFDEGNLLSLDRFPGSDRAETGWRAVAGLNWTLIAPGGWSAGATVGRVFHVRTQPDFTAASGLAGHASDWLAAFRLTIGERLSLTSRTIFDDDFAAAKSETRLAWTSAKMTLAGSHIWLAAEPREGRLTRTHEMALESSYRFATNWTGAASVRYDFESGRAAAAGLGVGFRNECVSLDLSLSRRFTSSITLAPATDVGLTISLGGFGGRGRRGPAATCGG